MLTLFWCVCVCVGGGDGARQVANTAYRLGSDGAVGSPAAPAAAAAAALCRAAIHALRNTLLGTANM